MANQSTIKFITNEVVALNILMAKIDRMPQCTGRLLNALSVQLKLVSEMLQTLPEAIKPELGFFFEALEASATEVRSQLSKKGDPNFCLARLMGALEQGERLLQDKTELFLNHLWADQFAVHNHAIVSKADRYGTIISANAKFLEISGYSLEELIGEDHALLNSGQQPKGFFKQVWETLLSGQVWHGTICNRSKKGNLYWVESTIQPILDSDGNVDHFISIRTDVSELKRVEKRLQQSQSFANIGSWELNVQTRELWWSERVAPIFGGDGKTLETSYENFMERVYPQDRQRLQAAVIACIEEGKEYNIEHRVVWKDGTVRWVSEKGDVVRDAHGQPLRMLGVVQDITESKEVAEQLKVAKHAAEAASKAKSEFLSNMSHELRTPLNSIIGFSDLLIHSGLEEKSLRQVENIQQSGRHLLELVNEVLDLSKIEAGVVEMQIGCVDVEQLIDNCLSTLQPMSERYGIDLVFKKPECRETLLADFTRLKQVLLNFLSNAIKYNRPNGEVRIGCEPVTVGEQAMLKMSVSDTGIGIPADRQSQVFEPFDRLGHENQRVEGTGIGLSITKKLIEGMGGQIGFHSVENEGSVFWCALPLAHTDDRETARSNLIEKRTAGHTASAQPSQKVLYIESSPFDMQAMSEALSAFKEVALSIAPTAEIGLDKARELTPEYIIVNTDLLGKGEHERQQYLKLLSESAGRNSTVMVLAPREVAEQGLFEERGGVDRLLTYPLQRSELVALFA